MRYSLPSLRLWYKLIICTFHESNSTVLGLNEPARAEKPLKTRIVPTVSVKVSLVPPLAVAPKKSVSDIAPLVGTLLLAVVLGTRLPPR